ncbi:hypothetical protein [Frankia sp. Cppng1_Ct_nod]|uniref:hypothetical protein n=1 Tax=Frankia sp. Cppng1_Ct_nod TaxID=2897162 RepID=UPI0013EF7976|nr:hypothetical protein [Frankia sp. Cppng1_Ct_nod]
MDTPWGKPVSSMLAYQPAAGRQTASPPRSDDLPATVRAVLTRIAVGDHVASDAFADAFQASVDLPAPTRDVVLGSLMTAVMARGPAVDDVEALLRSALAVDGREPAEMISGGDRPMLMLAGSGKKGLRTLNVSTPAALVAAAAGARVIKVGSAATSSALGSRDLVRALGLREHRTADGVRADLAVSGFAFVAIEPEIPVLDRLYGGRFHAPNPFSFGLAPLASPVRGDVTIFGLSHPCVDVAARVLSRFGMNHVDVLSTRLPGGHYLDEIGPAGELRWCRVRDGEVSPVDVEPAEGWTAIGLPGELPTPHGPEEAIERTGELLTGRGLESHRALVALNAAHLLVLSGLAASLPQGRNLAEDILRSGTALARVPAARSADRSA